MVRVPIGPFLLLERIEGYAIEVLLSAKYIYIIL
jgi:hypothetical protein